MAESDQSLPELPFRASPAPPAELSARIRAECTENLAPKKSLGAGARLGLSLLLGALGLGLVTLLLGPGRPLGSVQSALIGAAAWAIVLALLLGLGLAMPPGKRVSRSARIALAIGIPIAFLVYLGFAAEHHLPLASLTHAHGGRAFECGLFTLGFGILTTGAVLFVWRRTDPYTPELSGTIAGLAGGLCGALSAGVGCPTTDDFHLWLAHGGVVIALMAGGWLVGRRLLAP